MILATAETSFKGQPATLLLSLDLKELPQEGGVFVPKQTASAYGKGLIRE